MLYFELYLALKKALVNALFCGHARARRRVENAPRLEGTKNSAHGCGPWALVKESFGR